MQNAPDEGASSKIIDKKKIADAFCLANPTNLLFDCLFSRLFLWELA
jgi:hypothetical protein